VDERSRGKVKDEKRKRIGKAGLRDVYQPKSRQPRRESGEHPPGARKWLISRGLNPSRDCHFRLRGLIECWSDRKLNRFATLACMLMAGGWLTRPSPHWDCGVRSWESGLL
jgi:hypothetical protein